MRRNGSAEGKERWWDPLAAALLLAGLLTSALRLAATQWTEDLEVVETMAVLGAFVGLAVGQSRFAPRWAVFFGLAYGVFAIPWQLGLSLGGRIGWVERLVSLGGRLEMVLGELLSRKPVTDNMLFLFLMSCLFWALGVHAGYTLTRHGRPWAAVLPAGLAAFVIHTFDPILMRRTWYLAFYLFFALLVVARLVYLKNVRLWRRERLHLPPDAGFDWMRATALLAMFFVLAAWTMPALAGQLAPAARAWQSLSRPWEEFKDRLSYAFAALQASAGLVVDYYDENLALGRGNFLSDEVVLEVDAPADISPPRYYWRARVYDIYDGKQWLSGFGNSLLMYSESSELSLVAAQELEPGLQVTETGRLGELTFYPQYAISVLYAAPQPVWVSRPSNASVFFNPDGTVDLGSIQAQEYLRPGERYTVRSQLSMASIWQLRAAGEDYPAWVRERYLQLPEGITPRTVELAQRIAADLDNPYDIAEAVTRWLRQNIAYAERVPEIPPEREAVDWFLFDLRRGFCNYYASAEVVLLRAVGVPARLAVGFAEGEKQSLPQGGFRYVVRQREAHAWPEVYFPGIGWVEFEPTVSQAPLVRPAGVDPRRSPQDRPLTDPPTPDDAEPLLPNQGQADLEASAPAAQGLSAGQILRLILLGLGSGWLIFAWRSGRRLPIGLLLERAAMAAPVWLERGVRSLGLRPPDFLQAWARYASLPPLHRSYHEINRALSLLKGALPPSATPAERVSALSALLPEAAQPAAVLLGEYQDDLYGENPGDEGLARQAGQAVRRAARRAWVARLWDRLRG